VQYLGNKFFGGVVRTFLSSFSGDEIVDIHWSFFSKDVTVTCVLSTNNIHCYVMGPTSLAMPYHHIQAQGRDTVWIHQKYMYLYSKLHTADHLLPTVPQIAHVCCCTTRVSVSTRLSLLQRTCPNGLHNQ
jgi:hypothetical protein